MAVNENGEDFALYSQTVEGRDHKSGIKGAFWGEVQTRKESLTVTKSTLNDYEGSGQK